MLDPQLLATLQQLPLFAGLPPQQLERLARIARVARYDPGTVVFRQWDVARGFYMLLSGRGQLIQQGQDGGQRLLADVQAGQYFNEAALVSEIVEQASFVVTAPSLLLHIARADYATNFGSQLPAPAAVPAQGRAPGQHQPAQAAANGPRQGAPGVARGVQSPHLSPPLPEQSGVHRVQSAAPPRQPAGKRPEWLNPGETILLQTRRHWWAAVRRVWLPVLVFVGMAIAAIFVDSVVAKFILGGLALAVPGVLTVYFIFDWRNDWLVITDERVLRVEQIVARFSLQTNEVGLLSVQGVASSFPPGDPAARVLRYGNVVISTAGAAGNISMDFVPHPSRVKDYIFRQREIKMRAAQNGNNNVPQTPDSQIEMIEDPDSFPSTDNAGRMKPVSGGGLFTMRFVNENGDVVYRRHLVIWARHIFWPLLAFAACAIFLVFGPGIAAFRDAGIVAKVIAAIGCVIALIWLYLADWDWRNDLYIIGDGVITLLHRSPLLLQFREDQVLIQRIHNIEAETTGLLRSLLDYGDVRVLLLGDEQPKVFKDVPGPVGVREEISRRQREAAEEARQDEEQRQLDAVISRMQSQGMVPAANAAPAPGQPSQPAAPQVPDYRPPVQPQRPPIPRRRV